MRVITSIFLVLEGLNKISTRLKNIYKNHCNITTVILLLMPIKLEPFFLSTVALYIKGTTQFMVFRKVSKNVEEALKMLHINPYGVVSYLPFLLISLPNINTLYLNALNVQNELNKQQLQQITWIDSSASICHLLNINKEISFKVTSLRLSAKVSLCQYLNNFPNLRKLIIENAEYLNTIKVWYFKSLKVLKTLVLYVDSFYSYTNDIEEMLDELEKLLKENKYLTITIVSKSTKCLNRVSDINFYNFPELFEPHDRVLNVKKQVIINNDKMNPTNINEIVQNKEFTYVRDLEVSCQSFDGENFDVSKMSLKTLKINIKSTKLLYVSIPSMLEKITVLAPNQSICIQTEIFRFSFIECEFDCNIAFCDKKRYVGKTQFFNLKNTKSLKLKSQKYFYEFGTEMKLLKVFNICCPFKQLDFSFHSFEQSYNSKQQTMPLFVVKDVGCCRKLIFGYKSDTNILYYSNSAVDVYGKCYNLKLIGKIGKIYDYNIKQFDIENVESRTEFILKNTEEKKSIITEKAVIKNNDNIYLLVFKTSEYEKIKKDNELLNYLKSNLLCNWHYETKMCDHILFPNSKKLLKTSQVLPNSEFKCKIEKDEIVVYVDLFRTTKYLDDVPRLKIPSKSKKAKRIEKAPKIDRFKYEEWRVIQNKPKMCVGMYRSETTNEIKNTTICDVLDEYWIENDSFDTEENDGLNYIFCFYCRVITKFDHIICIIILIKLKILFCGSMSTEQFDVITKCWSTIPTERIEIEKVVNLINGLMNN
ncbi:hypothetical protein EIN_290900 [Entamoeba invadens IP1]|uniref:Uncharacterized protein n=1 Tax=Entamoeba invadens IP1 TaxID=370355 RepID=A0A0A1UE32_ENTIV|nr:hypothetical protein EIN_290900 [Entamoeba invadens IP1]ELP92021.1 hypothetical protein EIN_290900 [Entamoeba invadens IP1]|eukprot:XP_004258792.1 hypothetical protein EIN_290900 [Entamoeba invadens IP1]